MRFSCGRSHLLNIGSVGVSSVGVSSARGTLKSPSADLLSVSIRGKFFLFQWRSRERVVEGWVEMSAAARMEKMPQEVSKPSERLFPVKSWVDTKEREEAKYTYNGVK